MAQLAIIQARTPAPAARLGAKGVEAVPHLDMWRDLPWLVKDGIVFTIDTIKSKGRRPNYDGVL